MSYKEKWPKILRSLRIIPTDQEERALLTQLSNIQMTTIIGFINSHSLNLCLTDEHFYKNLEHLDLILRDGIGIKLLLKMLCVSPGRNLNGTDLIPKVIQAYSNRRVGLFGTTESAAKLAANVLREKYGIKDVVAEHGFHHNEYYSDIQKKMRCDIIILGMGMPKQEEVAVHLKNADDNVTLIVCGGAILDFLSGRIPRAPRWMRALAVEWVFRMCLEPRRLFKRYVIGNPVFLVRGTILAFHYRFLVEGRNCK